MRSLFDSISQHQEGLSEHLVACLSLQRSFSRDQALKILISSFVISMQFSMKFLQKKVHESPEKHRLAVSDYQQKSLPRKLHEIKSRAPEAFLNDKFKGIPRAEKPLIDWIHGVCGSSEGSTPMLAQSSLSGLLRQDQNAILKKFGNKLFNKTYNAKDNAVETFRMHCRDHGVPEDALKFSIGDEPSLEKIIQCLADLTLNPGGIGQPSHFVKFSGPFLLCPQLVIIDSADQDIMHIVDNIFGDQESVEDIDSVAFRAYVENSGDLVTDYLCPYFGVGAYLSDLDMVGRLSLPT